MCVVVLVLLTDVREGERERERQTEGECVPFVFDYKGGTGNHT